MTRVLPSVLCEVISVTSAICPRCFSNGAATAEAILSGLAPGMFGLDRDGREVDLRQGRDRQLSEREKTGERNADRQQRRRDGPANEQLGKPIVHGASAATTPLAALNPSAAPMRSKKR